MFNSVTDPIPQLRQEIEKILIQSDGEKFLALRDPFGYSMEILLFKPEIWELFQSFDGIRSIRQLQQEIFDASGEMIVSDQLLQFIQTLDRNLLLESDLFLQMREEQDRHFLQTTVRPAAHAGQAYPDNPDELIRFIQDLFDRSVTEVPAKPPVGIIVPHIDLRVGGGVYIPGYRALTCSDADTYIILGTSHYSGEDYFILTEKDFETPLGVLRTDKEFVKALRRNCPVPLIENDVAHRPEHSIEFQVLFLQYLFGNESKKIVPILCSSLSEFFEDGQSPMSSRKFQSFISSLKQTIGDLNRKVVYILSVDWSHIGHKFGDAQSASSLLPLIRESDQRQLQMVAGGEYDQFLHLLAQSENATRIDGFSCYSTFHFAAEPDEGLLLEYQQWHEEEKESGVTFASMAFYNQNHT